MFGIGMPELILILAVALIVIGPKKLPEVAQALGKAMGEFKRATTDLKNSVDVEDELTEVKDTFTNMKEKVWESVDAPTREDSTADKAPSPEKAESTDEKAESTEESEKRAGQDAKKGEEPGKDV